MESGKGERDGEQERRGEIYQAADSIIYNIL